VSETPLETQLGPWRENHWEPEWARLLEPLWLGFERVSAYQLGKKEQQNLMECPWRILKGLWLGFELAEIKQWREE
jgi:hypothetical protein